MTAPNGPQQAVLLRAALKNSGLGPGDVCHVALHGTGTPLGDPIEVGALVQALRGPESASGNRYVPSGLLAVKSCYGHTEGAAGLTGLLMTAMALHHRAWPGLSHCRTLNPHVSSALRPRGDGEQNGASVPRQCAPAAACGSSLGGGAGAFSAGTSSFGMSGTNAHAMVAGLSLIHI